MFSLAYFVLNHCPKNRFIMDRIWCADKRYNLRTESFTSYRVRIGKYGVQMNFKYSVIGFYFKPIQF